MADNSRKTPLAASLHAFGDRKIRSALQLNGKSLPASVVSVSGAIVTVKFEVNSEWTLPQVTIPLFGPIYIRYPIQPGDKGCVIAADAYLGGMSGLGGGVADLTQRANLAALVFLPFGNTEWATVDPQAVTVYGPNGVVLRDTASNSTFVLTPTAITMVGKDQVTISSGTTTVMLNASGSWSIFGTGAGQITADGGLGLTDGVFHTTIAGMNAAWVALAAWANSHTHPVHGAEAIATDTPYVGPNIAP